MSDKEKRKVFPSDYEGEAKPEKEQEETPEIKDPCEGCKYTKGHTVCKSCVNGN